MNYTQWVDISDLPANKDNQQLRDVLDDWKTDWEKVMTDLSEAETKIYDLHQEIKKLKIEVYASKRYSEKWIPVSENLPDNASHVLIYAEGYGVLRAFYGVFPNLGKDGFYDGNTKIPITCISHWMNLPGNPPEVTK